MAATTTKSKPPPLPLPRVTTLPCSTSSSSPMKPTSTTTTIAAATTTTSLQRPVKRLLFLVVLLQLHNAHPPYFFNSYSHHHHNHRSPFCHACWRPASRYRFHVDNVSTAALSYGCAGDRRHVWMTCESWGVVHFLHFIRLKQFIPKYGYYSTDEIHNPWVWHRPDKNVLIHMDSADWKLMFTASVAGWTAMTFPSSGYRLVKMGYGGRLVALTIHVPFAKIIEIERRTTTTTNTNTNTNTTNTNNTNSSNSNSKKKNGTTGRSRRSIMAPIPPTEDTVPENYGYYYCEVLGLIDGKRVLIPSRVIHVSKTTERQCQNQAL